MSGGSETYPVGCVVWYKHSGWPWWPSKVEEVELLEEESSKSEKILHISCFKTKDLYTLKGKAIDKLKPFVYEGVAEFVTKEKYSCLKRMSTYTDYCEALSLAVAYTREQKGDPSFSLGVDPYADVSTFKQKKMTPKSASTTKSLPRSQTKKSGASSTGRKTSSSTSKKGRNSRIVTGPTGSPALAEAPQDNENVRSSKRKRNRDTTQSEGKDPSELEVKRQRRSCGRGNTGKVEKDGGKEVVPKKLNFNDDNDEFVRTKEGVSLETPSSPVAKADHKPSSPCGGTLLNGHTDRLPSLHSVKKSLVSGSVKPGADKEEEREAAGLYSCGSKNGRDDTSPVLSDDDDDMETKEGDNSSDSDDNSFPSCNFSVDEALTVRKLKVNSIIWVKHSAKFPFWPALVTEVKKKKSASYVARVLYFGYDEKRTSAVRQNKYIAPFATKRRDDFLAEGRSGPYRVQFDQAWEEAQVCMDYRVTADNTTSTPRKMFDEVAKLRPKEYTRKKYDCPVWSGLEDDGAAKEQTSVDESKAGGQDEFLTGKNRLPFENVDEDTNLDLDNSDDEEEDAVYGYERVMAEVEKLRPELADITQGKIPSVFHQKMLEGTRKEQSQLKVAAKTGPLSKWPTSKLTDLATKLKEISEKASDGKLLMSYAYSVLLPEFTIRIIKKFESVSEEEAIRRLDHKKD